ncbi:MAG: ATP-grasp domain-containing protein [Oscillospiraceae bacterium]|nr:ATP-grasp domain-containing protein [Oscillospiraceae bacterium]
MKDTKQKTVIVAGSNYSSSLCMARSLGRAGYKVKLYRLFQGRPKLGGLMTHLRPESHSKYVDGYRQYIVNDSKEFAEMLVQNAQQGEKQLFVPIDDLTTSLLDENYNMLKEYYIMPNISDTQGKINELMSKQKQMELAAESGLDIVNSCLVTAENGVFSIPETVTYPCFVKPNISRNSTKNFMKKCENSQELQSTLAEFSNNQKIEMIVEDYLDIDREYSLLGLCIKDKAVAPGLFVVEKGGTGDRKGVTLVGRIVDTAPYKEFIDGILSFVKSLDFEGLFDVDIIQTKDGRMHFIELNLRYGASGHAVTESGANLPVMFADYKLKGQPVDTDISVKTTGKTFVSEIVMMSEYIKGTMSPGTVKNLMTSNDIYFIKDDEDPAPYRHYSRFYLPATALKILYTAKRMIKK